MYCPSYQSSIYHSIVNQGNYNHYQNYVPLIKENNKWHIIKSHKENNMDIIHEDSLLIWKILLTIKLMYLFQLDKFCSQV